MSTLKKNKNILLDLDETLVHTSENYHNLDPLLDEFLSSNTKPYIIDAPFINEDIIVNGRMWGSTRPYLEDFLIYCFHKFDKVIVWSAGTSRYVKETVKHVFSRVRSPHYVFTRRDCLKVKTGGVTKPIEHLAKNNPTLGLDLTNTLLIDDQVSNFEHNPNNGIAIPEYLPDFSVPKDKKSKGTILKHDTDDNLLRLITWFDSSGILHPDVDVRTVNKKTIFTT